MLFQLIGKADILVLVYTNKRKFLYAFRYKQHQTCQLIFQTQQLCAHLLSNRLVYLYLLFPVNSSHPQRNYLWLSLPSLPPLFSLRILMTINAEHASLLMPSRHRHVALTCNNRGVRYWHTNLR